MAARIALRNCSVAPVAGWLRPGDSFLHGIARRLHTSGLTLGVATAAFDASAASGEPIAMAAFFNPTNERMNATINLPLYYAGVAPGDVVNVTRAEPAGARLAIYSAAAPSSQAGTMLTANARSRVVLDVVVPGGGYAMFTVQRQRY